VGWLGAAGLAATGEAVDELAAAGLVAAGEATDGVATNELPAAGEATVVATAGLGACELADGALRPAEDDDEAVGVGAVGGVFLVDATAGPKAPAHCPNGLPAGTDELPGLPIRVIISEVKPAAASQFGALVVPTEFTHGPIGLPAQARRSPASPANKESLTIPRRDQSEMSTVVHPLYLYGTLACTSSRYSKAPAIPMIASVL
jgi:hypothetical protein